MTAVGIEAECGRVLAGELIEIRPHRGALLRDARHVGGRILDAGDIFQLEQPLHGVDRHVDHRTRRNIVDDDRNADRIVDRLEVLIKPFLSRLVVIGRHHQHGIGAGLFGVLGERDRFLGGIGAGAGDDRNAALRLLDAPLDHFVMLFVGQRRAFAGRADRNEPVGALGDLPIDQPAEGFLVDRAVVERRDERSE